MFVLSAVFVSYGSASGDIFKSSFSFPTLASTGAVHFAIGIAKS